MICFTNGCMADYEANGDMIGKMKKGQDLIVQAINSTGQPISLVLPLADFAKAYEGPPTDPKVFEEQQREAPGGAAETRRRSAQEAGRPAERAAKPSPGSAGTSATGGQTQLARNRAQQIGAACGG